MQVALSDHKVTDSPAQSQYVFTLFSPSPARMPRHGPGDNPPIRRAPWPLPQQKKSIDNAPHAVLRTSPWRGSVAISRLQGGRRYARTPVEEVGGGGGRPYTGHHHDDQ